MRNEAEAVALREPGPRGHDAAASYVPPPRPWRAFRPSPKWFRAGAWIVHRLAWRLRLLEYALAGLEREATSTVTVPLRKRIRLWRRGFLGESAVLYDLQPGTLQDYLSDAERFVGSRTINGPYAILLDDKLLFDRLLADFPSLKPRFFGVLDGARVLSAQGVGGDSGARSLRDLLQRERRLAIKPATGGGGRGFAVFEALQDGGFALDGAPTSLERLETHGRAESRLMVGELVAQHADLAALYPRTTNTLRLITMQDETGAPFVARAVARIGRTQSEPTDNWITGGLCAQVDLETGVLGEAASFPAESSVLSWYETHPESGAQICGARIPHWQVIHSGILEVARTVPFLPYVGWDLVVTPQGFKIIEGNSYSGVNLLQIHGPLLRDERVRDFFRRHGALRR
ncbi:MAG: sugar-transfer associated ATP-grasp domain-containing protein [Rhodovibrionaceae bacterium]